MKILYERDMSNIRMLNGIKDWVVKKGGYVCIFNTRCGTFVYPLSRIELEKLVNNYEAMDKLEQEGTILMNILSKRPEEKLDVHFHKTEDRAICTQFLSISGVTVPYFMYDETLTDIEVTLEKYTMKINEIVERGANLTDKYFKRTLRELLNKGVETKGLVRPTYPDGTEAHTKYVTNKVFEYDLSKGEYPLVTLRHQAWKSAIKEILWIYQDQSNDLTLLKEKHNIHWWDEWGLKDGTIGQRYGATVRRYDLVNKLLKDIKETPMSRRMIMNMYQYAGY